MLGDKIKYLREQDGISQKELAKILNVHRNSIYNWENNRSDPDYLQLKALANYFSVSIDYLLDYNYDEKELEEYRALVRNVDKAQLEKALKIIQMLDENDIKK